MQLSVQLLHSQAQQPTRSSEHAAGFDVYACERTGLLPGIQSTVRLGFAAAFPRGHVALVWDRSSLAAKHGVTALAGVIDADYRGEWCVVLYNTSPKTFLIQPGDRIAQVIFQKIETPKVRVVQALPKSTRNTGGFGSTGR